MEPTDNVFVENLDDDIPQERNVSNRSGNPFRNYNNEWFNFAYRRYRESPAEVRQRLRLNSELYVLFNNESPNGEISVTKEKLEKNTKVLKYNQIPLSTEEEGRKPTQCSICLLDYEDESYIRKLMCNHIFHKECIDEWLTYKHLCPLCRVHVLMKKRRQSNH